MSITKNFVKDSDNVLEYTIKIGGAAFTEAYTSLSIKIGDVTILRTTNENGVDLTSGVIQIQSGGMIEDLSALIKQQLYRVFTTVVTATYPTGIIFGADDSEDILYFYVSDPT